MIVDGVTYTTIDAPYLGNCYGCTAKEDKYLCFNLGEFCQNNPVVWVKQDKPESKVEQDIASLQAQIQKLRTALKDVIADAEYEGSDGWMTGCMHSNEYKAAVQVLKETE